MKFEKLDLILKKNNNNYLSIYFQGVSLFFFFLLIERFMHFLNKITKIIYFKNSSFKSVFICFFNFEQKNNFSEIS